jgi:NADH:ubiquinone reductase (H+-translocating)
MDRSHEHRERVSHAHLPRVVIVGEVSAARAGRIKVNPDLSVPGHPNVFAVGDTGSIAANTRSLFGIRSETPELLPGVAQVAIQGGRYVAGLIRRRVNGERSAKPFWYWDKGNMAIVGRTFAVADLKYVRFAGLTAWLLWAGIHIYFLIGFANRLLVTLQWAISFVTKRRGVRILPPAQAEMTHADPGRPPRAT